jgi:hypothetical protein
MRRLSLVVVALAAILCPAVPAAPERPGLLVEVDCPTLIAAQRLSDLDIRLALPGILVISLSPDEELLLADAGLSYRVLDRTGAGAAYYCASEDAHIPEGFIRIRSYPQMRLEVLKGPQGCDHAALGHWRAFPLPHGASPVSWFGSEPPEAARGRLAGGAAMTASQQVSSENIERIINELSYDAIGDTLRTRYSYRAETAEIALPYLEDLLGENLGEKGTVVVQPFPLQSGSNPPTGYNVIGRLEGSAPGSGFYILSGHYDSIGSRTKYEGRSWDWQTDPAPGADDNASGVAGVLECARVLADVDLQFDLYFVLFSGEEQVIKGSTYFVDNMTQTEGPLLGAINMDMIAYNPGQDTVVVVTDERSMWLADFLADSYVDLAPEVGDLTVLKGLKEQYLFSDETAFQLEGLPAVTCSEQIDIPKHNPYYHTIEDNNVEGQLNISQATKTTKLVAGALAALAVRQDPPDIEVLPEDIVFSAPPLPVVTRAEVGDTVTVSVRVRNVGGPMTATRTIGVGVYDGDPDAGAPLLAEYLSDREIPALGGFVVRPQWVVTERDKGSHRVTVVVSVDGGDDQNPSNNRAQAAFAIVGEDLVVLEHYVYPNPGSPSQGGATLHYFLTATAGVTVEVFDAMGRHKGEIFRPQMGGSRIPGYNLAEISLPLDEVVDNFSETPAGVYFYRITAENDERRQQVSGRFVMVR